MKYFYLFVPIVFLICFNVRAQEFNDSIHFRFNRNEERILFDRNWELNYPTLKEVDLGMPKFSELLFKGQWNANYIPFLQTIPIGNYHNLHIYQDKAFQLYVLTNPLSFGFEYHLKPVFNWKRLDIYFFGNGFMYNQSIMEKYTLGLAPPDGRNLYWEAGVGVEYKFNEHWLAFYEFAPSFMNKSYLGPKNKAGLRYRF